MLAHPPSQSEYSVFSHHKFLPIGANGFVRQNPQTRTVIPDAASHRFVTGVHGAWCQTGRWQAMDF